MARRACLVIVPMLLAGCTSEGEVPAAGDADEPRT